MSEARNTAHQASGEPGDGRAPLSRGALYPCAIIIDAKNLLYRHHHARATNPRMNQRGENVSALQGLADTLAALWTRGPRAIVCAMDPPGKTHRHQAFPGYKAGRKPTPPEMTAQLAVAPALAQALGAPWIERPGWEADDLIASLAFRAELAGYHAEIVTTDKDLQQMVSATCRVLKPALAGAFEELGPEQVAARWGGVAPHRLRHVLALMGDATDCVPGVKGIGEKLATDLVARFGSLAGVYLALSAGHLDIRPGVVRSLESGKLDAELSLALVTLKLDAPVPPWTALVPLCRPDPEALEKLARRYGLWLQRPDGATVPV